MNECTVNEPFILEGARNVRELGGYVNTDGKSLKTNFFLRGDSLSNLTEHDMELLREYGIKNCIDLRIDREKDKIDPFALHEDTAYYSIPIEGELDVTRSPEDIMYHLYVDILEHYQEQLCEAMSILADSQEGVIFHCSAGKDRTGIIAMFILSICGIPNEQIIADYATSGENILETVKTQLVMLEKAGVSHIPFAIFESTPATMRRLINYLDENYGSVTRYLMTIGVDNGMQNRIYRKLLEA